MERKLILLAGPAGSGKTTVARLLADLFPKASIVNVGDVLGRCLPNGTPRAEIGALFLALRGVEGIYEDVHKEVDILGKRDIFVDSLRLPQTCCQLKNAFPEARVWFVSAHYDLRVERLRRRVGAMEGAEKMIQAYLDFDRDSSLTDEIADVSIDNSATRGELEIHVRRALRDDNR
jgi:dephospho-CoA kinase